MEILGHSMTELLTSPCQIVMRGDTKDVRLEETECVMVSIAAPFFFTTNPAHLCALAVAILVSRKYGLAWTVAACVATAAVLGHLLG